MCVSKSLVVMWPPSSDLEIAVGLRPAESLVPAGLAGCLFGVPKALCLFLLVSGPGRSPGLLSESCDVPCTQVPCAVGLCAVVLHRHVLRAR
eukprot:scaffold127900_cov31-Prasinocladus_malaysianus.AAC.1